jgi:hypothetical protein
MVSDDMSDQPDFDPIIAERFSLLDDVAPPSPAMVGALTADGADIGQEGGDALVVPLQRRQGAVRSRLALAAAAVAVVTAGAVGLTVAVNDDQPGLEAGVDGASDARVEDESNAADDAESLVVQLPDEQATATDQPEQQADTGQGPVSAEADGVGSDAESDSGDGPSQESSGQQGQAVGPTTTTAGSEAAAETTETTAPTETTGSTEVESTTTTVASETTASTSWSTSSSIGDDVLAPVTDKEVRIVGTVTEVFTDCVSRLVLSETGQVESIGPVSCDGGSHIVVNGSRIQTTGGFGFEDDWLGKHPSDLRPGQRVTVIAVEDRRMGGRLSLDCVLCGVTKG